MRVHAYQMLRIAAFAGELDLRCGAGDVVILVDVEGTVTERVELEGEVVVHFLRFNTIINSVPRRTHDLAGGGADSFLVEEVEL